MRYFAGLMIYVVSIASFAGGWTSAGIVENIEVVRSQGFLIKGEQNNKDTHLKENQRNYATHHK